MAGKPTGGSTPPSSKPSGGDDILVGKKVADIIHGLGGSDQISGGDGNDQLWGDDGNDTLSGDAGNDDLRGGNGNDVLNGGTGNDSLNGGAGADVLTGGAGADNFDFAAFSDSAGAAVDRITDYSFAQLDAVVLGALDANAGVAGLQVWNYVQNLGDFTGDNGQATLAYDATSNTTTLNLFNNDGDSNADLTIVFDGQLGPGAIDVNLVDFQGHTFDGIIW